jgi:hypothetical protein
LTDGFARPAPLGSGAPSHFNIGGDVQRLHLGQGVERLALTPGREAAGGFIVGPPRVLIADGGGEEFIEARPGLSSGRNSVAGCAATLYA